MKKRMLFVVVYIICLPLSTIAVIIGVLSFLFISPVIWIVTGDEEKAWYYSLGSKVCNWLIGLPYKIIDEE
jgi:hypothetical protein